MTAQPTPRRTTVRTLEPEERARRVYDCECALHAAHQTGSDDWIARAADRLHEALVDYLVSR